jgi:hypothetical protein
LKYIPHSGFPDHLSFFLPLKYSRIEKLGKMASRVSRGSWDRSVPEAAGPEADWMRKRLHTPTGTCQKQVLEESPTQLTEEMFVLSQFHPGRVSEATEVL